MINVAMVYCECDKCGKNVSRPAAAFDTSEKLVCENCGEDYSKVALYIKEVEENG